MKKAKGVVRCMLVRPGDRQPIVEIFEGRARAGRGLAGDERARGKRGLTLLSAERWSEVNAALDTVLPWHARRANVLVEGMDLEATVGRRIEIGEVTLRVWGESKPCAEMDEIHAGLREVLATNGRGGVYGEILTDGMIRVGDTVRVAAEG